MVPCRYEFQELLAKGMEPGKMEAMEVTKEEGKVTTKVGGRGMVTEGAVAEGQVEVLTVEDRMVMEVVDQVTINREEMEGTKAVWDIGVAKAEVAPVEDINGEVASLETEDVVVKMEDKEGI